MDIPSLNKFVKLVLYMLVMFSRKQRGVKSLNIFQNLSLLTYF